MDIQTMDIQTPYQITQHYAAALDSVNLINELNEKASLTLEDVETIRRNQAHLQIMVDKEFWTDEDLLPFHDAIAIVVREAIVVPEIKL